MLENSHYRLQWNADNVVNQKVPVGQVTICYKRKWQPTPGLLPGESQGRRSVGPTLLQQSMGSQSRT